MIPLDVTVPKMPAAVRQYLDNWRPDTDARQWMKGRTPIWVPHAPIEVLAKHYAVCVGDRALMANRILSDTAARFPLSLKYGLPPATWDFRWPDMPKQYRLAPQETTLAHIVWAMRQGYVEAGWELIKRQFLAYYVHGWWDPSDRTNESKWYLPEFEMTPSEWSELRNFGNAAKNFGTRGRHRHPRGCLDYLYHTLCALDIMGIKEGAAVEWLNAKLAWHVENLHDKFPLIDDPAGDHFGPTTPFVSVYQTASLWSILWRIRQQPGIEQATLNKVRELCHRIEALLIDYGHHDGAKWYYDIPFKDGKPRNVVPGEPGAQVNDGVSGVASYLVPMLDESLYENAGDLYGAMIADAKAKQWPTKQPVECAWAFGTLDL